MNKKILKILLCDPRHQTVGAHSSYVPINIGYITEYLKSKFKDTKMEIKLSTDPKEIFGILEKWKPDILGSSNYVWNSGLSNEICNAAKKNNPEILTVIGGPEFPAGTGATKIENTEDDKTYDLCFDYLLSRPNVDYFAFSDGEVAFLEILKQFELKNFSIKELKKNDFIVNGFASISLDKKNLLVGKYIPRIGVFGSVKSQGRDIIPSPYLSGILDKFLNGRFIPAFETARGCPFLCTFCDQGLDATKITTYSTARMAEEFEYVGKKMIKFDKGTKTVAVFDSNWGLFEKDIDLSNEIRKTMDKYDWPQFVEIMGTPKSNRENQITINDKLKNRTTMGLSMQTFDYETLSNIKRKNLTMQEHIDFIQKIKDRGLTSTCEMIIPLPGETEQTFLKGIKFLLDHAVKTEVYTLMMLCGADLGREKAIKDYQMKDKYRILSKQFGEYDGKKIFEVERVCIETSTMNYDSWFNLRSFSFILSMLGSAVYDPVYKLVNKLGLSWYEIILSTNNICKDEGFSGKLKDLYNDFRKEAAGELFETREDAVNFYLKPENYQKLLNGEVGENLLGKYTAKGLLFYEEIIGTIFYILKNQIQSKSNKKEITKILDSSEKWLKNFYMINEIFGSDEKEIDNTKTRIEIDFDFPSWVTQTKEPLNNFIKPTTYELCYDLDKINYLKNELKSIYGDDKDRAFGRYMMQYMDRGADVWEKKFQLMN